MNTFKELLEAKIKRDLVSMAPVSPGEQNFVDRQTINKTFSDKFLVPDNGVFKSGKDVKVYNRKANRMGRDTNQSITDYDKGDTKNESENLEEFWFNKDGKFRKITKRNTKHARHIIFNGKVLATTSDANTNKEAIKHFLATTTDKVAKSKIKVESLKEKEFEVGKKVHAGLATKGGAGYVGVIKEVGKNHLHIHIGSSKFGDRVVKAHKSVCTLEASGPSEMKQIYEAISNPNTSGQGHDEDHKNHPLHGTLEKYGYAYSHSTPIKRDHYIAAGGDFKQAPGYTAHSYFHGDTDHCCSINSDSYKWHSKTSPASGRVTSGEGAITLDRHLKNKAKRYDLRNPVVDATKVDPANASDNAIHAGIRDDGIDAGHNDHGNAIHASIHHDERHIGHKDDVVGENIKESHWIQKAIKHPGALTRKAKREGVSNSEFEQEHKGDSGTTGKEARLALTLKKMHNESVEPEKDKGKKKEEKKDNGKKRQLFDRLLKSRGMRENEINEISKELLGRYIKKASVSAMNYNGKGIVNNKAKYFAKSIRRQDNLNKAVDKLTKEEEVNEGWRTIHYDPKTDHSLELNRGEGYYHHNGKDLSQYLGGDYNKALKKYKALNQIAKLQNYLKKHVKEEEKVNEVAKDTISRFANSKGKMKEDRSKIDSKNDKVDKVKEFINKRRGK